MDYAYYIKDKGPVEASRLNRLLKLVLSQELAPIPRFSKENEVIGIAYQQHPEIDAAVKDVQNSLVIPEIVGNPINEYYAIHYLGPGKTVLEHSDITNGVSWDDLWTHKLHIPLQTAPGVRYGFRRNLNTEVTWHTMEMGHLYIFNNITFHQVVNDSQIPRIQLIMYARDRRMKAHYDTNLNKRAPKVGL